MKVLIFGATGMVGQGVLRESLLAADVERVVTVGRRATGQSHPKLQNLAHENLFDLTAIERELTGIDACFFCLGVTSAGMSEADYSRITYDLTMSVARTLLRLNPAMTFVFVSGAGTDSSERGRTMWARVKGRAENALLALPFRSAVMFRPAFIEPLHGVTSRTRSYRLFYALTGPVLPLLRGRFPSYMTTTEQLGRAMLRVAREGSPKRILESADINRL